MENPIFFDDEIIPLVIQNDEDIVMIKQTSKLYEANSLKCIFDGINTMKNFLDNDKTPSTLETLILKL